MSQISFARPRSAPLGAGRAVAVLPWMSRWAARPAPAGRELVPAADAVAHEIGRDHAHHGLTPPVALLAPGHPVRQGWEAARLAFGARTLKAGDSVRAWLDLRAQAWNDALPFDTCHVTPHLIERLQPGVCPVTREPLAPAGRAGGNTQIARLDRQRGFEPGNLVLISQRAAQAREGLGFRAVVDLLTRLQDERELAHQALPLQAWARLAVLESFAVPLEHPEAARLPLLMLPPPRVPVVNPAQALQVMLTAQLGEPGYARRMAALAARVPASRSRQAFQVFLHTLLARRVALGQVAPQALRQGLEDAWRHPLVNQRWQAFVLGLQPADCERLVRLSLEPQARHANGHPKVAISTH